MNLNPPPKARVALYVFTALATPVVSVLVDQNILAQWVNTLWSGEVAAITLMAGLNVTVGGKK